MQHIPFKVIESKLPERWAVENPRNDHPMWRPYLDWMATLFKINFGAIRYDSSASWYGRECYRIIEDVPYMGAFESNYNMLTCVPITIDQFLSNYCEVYGLKVGDEVKAEWLNGWCEHPKNYHNANVSWRWDRGNGSQFFSHRKIEAFKFIDGVLGVEVSGAPGVYVRAEGFREFMDEIEKKEPQPGDIVYVRQKSELRSMKTWMRVKVAAFINGHVASQLIINEPPAFWDEWCWEIPVPKRSEPAQPRIPFDGELVECWQLDKWVLRHCEAFIRGAVIAKYSDTSPEPYAYPKWRWPEPKTKLKISDAKDSYVKKVGVYPDKVEWID